MKNNDLATSLLEMQIQLGVIVEFLTLEKATVERDSVREIQKTLTGLMNYISIEDREEENKNVIENTRLNVLANLALLRKVLCSDEALKCISIYLYMFTDRFNILLPELKPK